MTRPSKLTAERQEKIVALVEAGNYLHVAAAAAGISESTFHGWMQRGRTEAERLQNPSTRTEVSEVCYAEFYQAVTQAEHVAETVLVAQISKAAASNWQAALRLLERRHPERWSEKRSGTADGQDGQGEDSPGARARAIFNCPEAMELSLKTIEALGRANYRKHAEGES